MSSHDRHRPCLRDSSDGMVQIHRNLMKTITTTNNSRAAVLMVLATMCRISSHYVVRMSCVEY